MTSLSERQLAEWTEAIGKLGRVPQEWIGKTADSMPGGRVRDRILRTWDSVCYLSGLPIKPGTPWEAEHIIPVSMGGQNSERNLRPALAIEHAKKTRREAKERAKADRQRRAGNGTKESAKVEIKSAGFAPAPEKDRKPGAKERVGDGSGRWMFGTFVKY